MNGEDKIVVDFLGRFENLEEDYKYIAEKLSLKLSLPEDNRSINSREYRKEYLSCEAIDVVSEIYKQDILMFDYAF